MDGSCESALVSGTFDLDIAEKIPTLGNDTLLYKTGGSFDGREGIDTLLLRPGKDINFAADTWQHTGAAVEGTITFDVYASVLNSDITVRIQQEINDQLVNDLLM